jgi:succinate dehydrogenase / fumarate reductase cytochrome b subunit
MRIFECALLFGLLFHALNGLRLIAIDVWDLGTRAAVRLLSVVFLVSAAAGAAGSIVILAPVIS